ncbi:transposase [Pseudomonas marginalis]|uniref:transposase n=1 Tax=Pseudomonas marginalis TaxID=298 RepID=UPI0009BA67AF
MRKRSSYPKPFKAQVVQECLQPGATISSVAIHHGISANVIRKWLPIYRINHPQLCRPSSPYKPHPSAQQKRR